MRTIATSIEEGLAIRGVKVRYVSPFNVFHGIVSHQDGDGLIVAEGSDVFGPSKIRGPAWNFEITS
jgi:hypothetical protein